MTKAEIKNLMDSYIEKEQRGIDEHNKIKEMLREVEGKAINKKTFNEKRLGEFRLIYKYGIYRIEGKEGEHIIGYDTEPFVSVEKFEKLDACYGKAAEERIEKIRAADIEMVFQLYGSIQYHFEQLRNLFGDIERSKLCDYHFPLYCDLLSLIQGEESKKYVNLNNFYFIRK